MAVLNETSLPEDWRDIHVLHQRLTDLVYTAPSRARGLLHRQEELLGTHPRIAELSARTGIDYRLSNLLFRADLESQEYNHTAAGGPLRAALRLVEHERDPAQRLETYLAYVGYLSNIGQTEEASTYLDRTYRLLEDHPNPRYRARAACRHGYLYLLYYSYPKATRKFLEATRILDSNEFELRPKDHYFFALAQSGIGTVYQNSGDSEQAVEAFRRAIERCERFGLRARLPWHQLNLGKQLIAQGQYEGALTYFESVVDSQANGSAPALAAAYANLGFCYHHLDSSERATAYLDRAEAIYRGRAGEDTVELASIGFMRATLLMDAGNWTAAIRQLESTLPTVEVNNRTSDPRLLSMVADAYLYLALCYEKVSDYQSAYHHHRTYDHYNRRFHGQIDLLRQQQVTAQFRAEEREQENRRLKLLASQLQLRALRAQMNPHFLYNALNSIQSFVSTNAEASRYLAKFAMLMRQSLEYSKRESISLEAERKFLSDYLEINRHLRFEGQLSYTVTAHPELEEDIIGIPTMILQPYVENAIEHGLRGLPSGHIDVVFVPDGADYLLATVTDNGIGRAAVREIQAKDDLRAYHQSRGTEITESRLQLLSRDPNYRVEIEDLVTEEGKAAGTRVHVRIPTGELSTQRHANSGSLPLS
jgi:tetratricopeptide (TPR) repeat protein